MDSKLHSLVSCKFFHEQPTALQELLQLGRRLIFQNSFVDIFLVGVFGDRNPFGSIATRADENVCATIYTCRELFGVRV